MSNPQEPDDDAAWRSIVENYGDRPDLGELDTEQPEPAPSPAVQEAREPDPEDHYVPPPPPPIPHPDPPRLLAWLGLFGVPALVLVCLLAHVNLPTWSGLILMVWFVGGFVYLVASMRPGAGDDDYDDGAVL